MMMITSLIIDGSEIFIASADQSTEFHEASKKEQMIYICVFSYCTVFFLHFYYH